MNSYKKLGCAGQLAIGAERSSWSFEEPKTFLFLFEGAIERAVVHSMDPAKEGGWLM